MKNTRGSAPVVLAAQRDYLVIPAHVDIMSLVAVRYENAVWAVTPEQAKASGQAARSSGGARFRGAAVASEVLVPQVALDDGLVITGPAMMPAGQAQSMGLEATDHQLFLLPETSLPGHEAVLAWARTAARHCGGAIYDALGQLRIFDPGELVTLRLFSADPQPMNVVLELVRPVLPRIQPYARGDGSEALYATSEYDGTIIIGRERAGRDLPPVLATVNWRDFGPHIYEVSWIPPGGPDIDVADSSPLVTIARRRVIPMIAKTVRLLQENFEGTVLDSDDFLVLTEALEQRTKGG